MTTAANPGIFPGSQDGFTLMEILVSLAVLAIVMLSLFRLHSSSLELAESAGSKRQFPLLARQVLAGVQTGDAAMASGSGELFLDGDRFEWSCTVDETGFAEPIPISAPQARRLKKLVVTITDPAGRSRTLTTWRYQVERPGK